MLLTNHELQIMTYSFVATKRQGVKGGVVVKSHVDLICVVGSGTAGAGKRS